MTPYRIAANSAIHWLRTDRTRKGNLVQQALRARPAEVRRSGVLTARREEGEREWWGCTYGEFLLCISQHLLPQQENQIRNGSDHILWFQRSLSTSPTPLLYFMQERKIAIIYWNIGPNKKWAGMGTNSIFYNKTLLKRFM